MDSSVTMRASRPPLLRPARTWLATVYLVLSALVMASVPAPGWAHPPGSTSGPLAARATLPPAPPVVQSTSLPTVQVDGVVWTQAVVGDIVYVGGKFTEAISPEGASVPYRVPRANVLAYHLHTGDLVETFQADTDAQVMTMAVSPDQQRLYLGGDFTRIGGVARWRIAAIDLATGKPDPRFTPDSDAKVRAITVTDSAVYVGGGFSKVRKVPRQRLAALTPEGALLDWAPSANNSVNALVATPDQKRVIVGGAFTKINGEKRIGLASVDVVSGQTQPFEAAFHVQNGRDEGTRQAAVTTLTTDGTSIYGGAYTWNSGGTFEGVFAADPVRGRIQWMADCHGDTYSVFPQGKVVYQVGHWHSCSNIGGFANTNPYTYHRAASMYNQAVGVVLANQEPFKYDFAGMPATALLSWLPDVEAGKITGQEQGGWHVTGNDEYVVMGGEFPRVAGVKQRGLARFVLGQAPAAQSAP